ncbi:hypothetical protein BV283P1_00018 [Phocaeicola phage BV283P1]|nr:hypothetical protein BV283P1_00018 [Phocaeicola phage BV283P1]
MKITYINTGDSIGSRTYYVATIVIPIAAGLKQELLFEEMSDVAYMTIEVSRNGTPVHNQRLTPASTMRMDLSTFAQVLPSLNELYKNLEGEPASNAQDMIKFVLLDGVTVRTYIFYVCSLNCPYLNSKGWARHDERNLVANTLASMVDTSTVVTGSGTKELVTSSVRGTGTKIKGSSGWIAGLPNSGTTIPTGVEVTQSIYVENVGASPFMLVARFAVNTEGSIRADRIKIPVGFSGVVSSTRVMGEDYAPNMFVSDVNGLPMEANFYTYMLNYGSEPKPWIKAGANAGSPCVGAMTDYRSGKLFDTGQVVSAVKTTTNLDLVGERRYARMYYPVGEDSAKKDNYFTSLSGVGSAPAVSGSRLSEIHRIRLVNSDGSVYGWMEYENKLPKDVSPNCGVLLRWLNSRGFIDSMFFEKYSIKPVMRTSNNGGNGIDYYETTLQIDVNWDNEPCLNWIQRSSDIIARIPIDICQFGRATLLATNVFKTQGGSKTKTIQFKFKVQIVEP